MKKVELVSENFDKPTLLFFPNQYYLKINLNIDLVMSGNN